MNKTVCMATSKWHWLAALFLLAASGCGGGGNDTPAAGPAPAPAPNPAPPALPTIAPAVNLDDNHQVGNLFWPDGDTATGGHGSPVDGIPCGAPVETFHIHTHLSIFVNGDAKALPAQVGIPQLTPTTDCHYYVHTHDHSGKIHMEAPAAQAFTLGNLFDIWGQPLTATNVAGVTNLPMYVYIYDATTITQFTGDPTTIPMLSHRHIAIVLGTPITQVPYFTWTAN
ncbi:MAG TPA: hypothetical protein VFU71_04795 [Burkholderiaceae bacterium]|nr:hypothetical protein [Burkholderiaceae bacterium]